MSIWDFNTIADVPDKHRLTLNEGHTTVQTVNLQGTTVTLKREDKNPNGSFKDRSLAYQLSYHISQGKDKFVISSSGNAAISAAAYATLAKVSLSVFVSPKISEVKMNKLLSFKNQYVSIEQSLQAKSAAINYAREHQAFNLRGSDDPMALVGFKTIAFELAKQYPQAETVFIPCSSGTSAIGIAQGYTEVSKQVAINICQTERIHPLAKEFDADYSEQSTSLADAIVDRVAKRKQDMLKIITATGGSGWIISDAQLNVAKSMMQALGYADLSYNSLLAVAGYLKAKQAGKNVANSILIISGT